MLLNHCCAASLLLCGVSRGDSFNVSYLTVLDDSCYVQTDSVKGELYVAFNASHLPVTVTLPERPGYMWEPFVDTAKPAPFDILSSDLPEKEIAIGQYAHFLDANLYPMLSYSSIILLLSPDDSA